MLTDTMIEEMLVTNPLSLLAIRDEQVINRLDNLLPYSSAFEIECDMTPEYSVESFKAIPDIMDVDPDHWEQRYRIPNGLRGIICLCNISHQLKRQSLLNPLSSIHYHVDCTGCYKEILQILNKGYNVEYVLKELDTWLVDCTATSRGYGNWFRVNSLQTLEFRLGEMTFEFPVLLKRLIHCNKIVKKFKDELGIASPTFIPIDRKAIMNYLKVENISHREDSILIKSLKKLEEGLIKSEEDSKQLMEERIVVRKRINRIEDE